MVSEGYTSKEIARELGIAVSTVNEHIDAMRSRADYIPRKKLAMHYRRWLEAQMLDHQKPHAEEVDDTPQRIRGDAIRVENDGIDALSDETQAGSGLHQAARRQDEALGVNVFGAEDGEADGKQLSKRWRTPKDAGILNVLVAIPIGALAVLAVIILDLSFVDSLMKLIEKANS